MLLSLLQYRFNLIKKENAPLPVCCYSFVFSNYWKFAVFLLLGSFHLPLVSDENVLRFRHLKQSSQSSETISL